MWRRKPTPATKDGSRQKGQALVELLVAMGIAALLLPAMATAMVATREGRAQEGQRLEATALLREGNEAVRSIREKGWTAFAVNGTYKPAITVSTWSLAAGAETIGNFTRSIVISDAQRNSGGAIVASGGTVDGSTKKVVVNVSWTTPTATTISNETYLSRYTGNLSWSQTTQAELTAGTKTNTAATATGGGQVELGATPLTVPAFVRAAAATNDSSAATIAATFSVNVTAGNLIAAAVSWDTTTASSVLCSDNRGNVYTVITTGTDATNTQALAICYASNAAAGATTVTATFSTTASTRRITICEYSGVVAASPVDVTVSNVADGTTAANNVTSTAATPAAAGDLIFGTVMETATGTTTIAAGTNFTQRNLNNSELAVQDRVLPAAGSVTSTQTFNAARRYVAQMVAFKSAGTTTNWAAPQIAGSYDNAGTQDALDVYALGNYAYVADGTVLTIYNISNPAVPTLAGTFTATGNINHVYVVANYAYLSTDNNAGELQIVTITNPASPVQAALVNLTGNNDALTTFVFNNYAYVGRVNDVTAGNNEFYIVNVANPASPTTMGSLNFAGNVNNIKVNSAGTYAFLATSIDAQEVSVVSVSNKSAPALTTSYNSAGTADGVDLALDGNTLYLAEMINASGGEVFIINMATPTAPVLLGSYEANATTTGVSVANSTAFVSTSTATKELIVLNVASPASPALLNNMSLGVTANDVKALGDDAYVATTSDTQELMVVSPTITQPIYAPSGTFESTSFDAGSVVGFNYLTFTITEPASTNIQFQVATNANNTTWNYVGPDGTAATFFTAAGSVPINTITGRYLRYKASFTGTGVSTPAMSDVSVNYSP